MPLLGCDGETQMVGEHPLLAAELIAIGRRPIEYFRPPRAHVGAMGLADAAWEESGEKLVALDAVVEGVDHAFNGVAASGPFKEGRQLGFVHAHLGATSSVARCPYNDVIDDFVQDPGAPTLVRGIATTGGMWSDGVRDVRHPRR